MNPGQYDTIETYGAGYYISTSSTVVRLVAYSVFRNTVHYQRAVKRFQ